MQLKDYIQGNKRGKEANRLERDAMNDPFLREALAGFDKIAGNHVKIINRLEKRFTHPTVSTLLRRNMLLCGSIAASLLLLIGLSTYFLMENDRQSNLVFAENRVVESEEYVLASPKSLSDDLSEAQEAEENFEERAQTEKDKAAFLQNTFGEKEFQVYCQQMADKNVCKGRDASVEVSFTIDETGKPAKIEFKKYSCPEAKKEIENLLVSSPVWTKTNRKVTITIKW